MNQESGLSNGGQKKDVLHNRKNMGGGAGSNYLEISYLWHDSKQANR